MVATRQQMPRYVSRTSRRRGAYSQARPARFTPWQLIVSTLTGVYAVRNFDKILGLQGTLVKFTATHSALMQLEYSPGATRRFGQYWTL